MAPREPVPAASDYPATSPVRPPRPAHAFEIEMPLNLGTPGLRNTAYIANRGPDILDVRHTPILPAAGEPIVVTARIDDNDGIGSVTLYHRAEGSGPRSPAAHVGQRLRRRQGRRRRRLHRGHPQHNDRHDSGVLCRGFRRRGDHAVPHETGSLGRGPRPDLPGPHRRHQAVEPAGQLSHLDVQ